jgi:hypothetical protein
LDSWISKVSTWNIPKAEVGYFIDAELWKEEEYQESPARLFFD